MFLRLLGQILELVCPSVCYSCWQCGDEGQDNVMGGVFRCSVNNCGRFYHRHCVELNANSAIKADLDEVRLMLARGFA